MNLKKSRLIALLMASSMTLVGCQRESKSQDETAYLEDQISILNEKISKIESDLSKNHTESNAVSNEVSSEVSNTFTEIVKKFSNKTPYFWGEEGEGIISRFDTSQKNQIALTLDACGGANGSSYDEELINFLIQNDIPATLFVNYRWIEANEEIFLQLADNPLFQIENHGYEHKPLSVNGQSKFGIDGTEDVEDVLLEIKKNEEKIYQLTGKKTTFFRSGTAYYDDVAIQVANELGYSIAGFSVNGDIGASLSREEIVATVNSASSGDIIISHFNQPQGDTYEGLSESLIKLKNDGYEFVLLEDVVK